MTTRWHYLYLLKKGFSTRSSSFIVFYISIMVMLSWMRCANISASNVFRYENQKSKEECEKTFTNFFSVIFYINNLMSLISTLLFSHCVDKTKAAGSWATAAAEKYRKLEHTSCWCLIIFLSVCSFILLARRNFHFLIVYVAMKITFIIILYDVSTILTKKKKYTETRIECVKNFSYLKFDNTKKKDNLTFFYYEFLVNFKWWHYF